MRNEPVIVAFLVQYLVALAARRGFDLEPGLLTEFIGAGLGIVAAFIARSQVTPVAPENKA